MQNAQQIVIVQVKNIAQVIIVFLQTQMNAILTVNVLDSIKNVDLEVAKGIGVKTQDQPEEQIRILEVVLEQEAMLPSNFHQLNLLVLTISDLYK